ncbi:hypothetical protein ACLKA7_003842 [Drosophila subpalustris]
MSIKQLLSLAAGGRWKTATATETETNASALWAVSCSLEELKRDLYLELQQTGSTRPLPTTYHSMAFPPTRLNSTNFARILGKCLRFEANSLCRQ